MTSTCGLRIAVERPPRQLGSRLAARDVDRRDDEVEAGQQVVLEVELAVGPDLELAAVEQPEALGRRLGRGVPAASSAANAGVERRDDRALLLDPLGDQAARDRERLRVVGQDLVGVATAAAGLGHDLDRVDAVGPVGVGVEVAAQVGLRDERRQPAGERRLDLAAVLAQLGLDERQARGTRRPRSSVANVRSSAAAPVSGSPSSPIRRKPFSDRLQPRSRAAPARPDVVLLRAREVDEVRPRLAGRHHHQVDLRAADQPDRRLVAALLDHLVDDARAT